MLGLDPGIPMATPCLAIHGVPHAPASPAMHGLQLVLYQHSLALTLSLQGPARGRGNPGTNTGTARLRP